MHEKVRRETRHPIQKTGMHRKGERNVHPYQNDSFSQVLCVRKTYAQSCAVDLTGQLALSEKRTKCKLNVDKCRHEKLSSNFGK